ncbi:MAG TPA: hypothetical protein VFL84_05655 [Gammaproteobacteria bacterium]|nr:hypothetical protein [Gammaproteobacteria bacterium]
MNTTTRRRFFGGAVVLATPLAASAAVTRDDIAARLAALEDASSIRALLRRHVLSINRRAGAAPETHVRSVALDDEATVDVASDGTAAAQVLCTVQTAKPIAGDGTLVEMARLQGDGVVKRSERRVLFGRFVKRNGVWALESAELRT